MINQPIVWSIIHQKKVFKNPAFLFPTFKGEVFKYLVIFQPNKPKDIQFTIIEAQEKQDICIFKKLETGHV